MADFSSKWEKGFIKLIGFYRILLSPFLGNCCRFTPSCSQYAQDAIRYHGYSKGLRLITLRLLRCHPWYPGGYDPVPTNRS